MAVIKYIFGIYFSRILDGIHCASVTYASRIISFSIPSMLACSRAPIHPLHLVVSCSTVIPLIGVAICLSKSSPFPFNDINNSSASTRRRTLADDGAMGECVCWYISLIWNRVDEDFNSFNHIIIIYKIYFGNESNTANENILNAKVWMKWRWMCFVYMFWVRVYVCACASICCIWNTMRDAARAYAKDKH